MTPEDGKTAPSVIDSIQRLLSGLQRTPDGVALYGLIARALKKYSGPDGRVETAFVAFLHKLLDTYLADPQADPSTRIKARVLQQRLMPFVPRPAATPKPTPSPARPAAQAAEPSAPVAPAAQPSSAAAPDPAPTPRQAAATPPAADAAPTAPIRELTPSETADADAEAGSDEIERMQLRLARKVAETIARNRDFDTLLKTNLTALEDADEHGGMQDIKHLLVDGIRQLIEEQQTLGQQLRDTTNYLKVMHQERRQLRAALQHARKQSLNDDVTGLPNRAAFRRQLEGEIGRAKRYGFSLVVAIIVIDNLAALHRQYGIEAVNAVLHCYSQEVMNQFRAYDVVARYDDDEFAVLFPNTQKEGASRALEKAQRRAAETVLSHQGRQLPLPTFSSVLTLYSPGEKAGTLLKRASEALDLAKVRGPNQSVVALPMP